MSSQGQVETKPDITKSKGGEGNGNRKKGRFRGQQNTFVQPTKFKGETEALHGHIYDVGTSNQADLFTETTKKIAGYAGRTCKEPQDIRRAIEDIDDINIPMPSERTSITEVKIREKLFEKDIENWAKRESVYRQNKASLYSIVLGQCSEAMRSKLESDSTYDGISGSSDVIELLKLIRNIAFAYESKRYPYLAVFTGIKSLYGNYQRSYTTVDNYLESFTNLVQVIEHCGGNFGTHPTLVDYNLKANNIASPDPTQRAAAEENSKEAYMATAFLCGLNKEKYQELLDDLSNAYLAGRDEYPKTLVDSYNLVINWRG